MNHEPLNKMEVRLIKWKFGILFAFLTMIFNFVEAISVYSFDLAPFNGNVLLLVKLAISFSILFVYYKIYTASKKANDGWSDETLNNMTKKDMKTFWLLIGGNVLSFFIILMFYSEEIAALSK